MSKRKLKSEESRRMRRVNMTLDTATIQGYERLKKREGLASLSAAIRHAIVALERETAKP